MEHLDVKEPLSRLGLSQNPNSKMKNFQEIQETLDNMAKFDVTNPWVMFYQGLFEFRKGAKQDAKKAWSKIFHYKRLRWYHLLPMGTILHNNNMKQQAKDFHNEAMQRYFHRGFQPRMQLLLIDTSIHKGALSKKISDLRKLGKFREASEILDEKL